MASLAPLLFLSLLVCATLSGAYSQTPSAKPRALVLPISKASSVNQYLTQLSFGTPPEKKTLVVDLEGENLWIDCDSGYSSSTYKPASCGSAACSVASAECTDVCASDKKPGCNNNTCRVWTRNLISGNNGYSEIAIDTISGLKSTDGSKALSSVSIPNFLWGCSNSWNLMGLANGAGGMLGLSRQRIAVPTQLSATYGGSFQRKFAICLPSSSKSNGVLFFGNSPYVFYPGYNKSKAIDVSSRFQYTRLLTRTGTERQVSPEYFLQITSILVNGKTIPINSTLLRPDRFGEGGTKITTIEPYTNLEASIYKALVKVFDEEIAKSKAKKVAPVAPFTDCYSKGNLGGSVLGLGVPDISFVFENKNVKWDIFGANSMVEVSSEVACLAFINRGDRLTTRAVVIGAHQLQDNLLQFDLASSRLGFTKSLRFAEVECSNFKF